MIKENLDSRIVFERLGLRLDMMEEENEELVETFHSKMKSYKAQEKEDSVRI